MDPFSFAASVLAVVETTTKVTITIVRYVSAVREAEDSRQRLLQELTVISGTLTGIKGLVDGLNAGGQGGVQQKIGTLASLDGPTGPLSQYHKMLTELIAWLNVSPKMTLGQKFMWPLKQEKKVMGFITKLERYKSIFTLALSGESL